MSQLKYGTEEEHRATLDRARENGVTYVWSGDIRRNPYLAENLQFGVDNKIITTTFVENDQESGWEITWLKKGDNVEAH